MPEYSRENEVDYESWYLSEVAKKPVNSDDLVDMLSLECNLSDYMSKLLHAFPLCCIISNNVAEDFL